SPSPYTPSNCFNTSIARAASGDIPAAPSLPAPAATGAEPPPLPPPPPNPANAEAIIGNIPIAIIPAIGSTPATNAGSTNGSGSS
ncbi:hypothetical protein IU450_39410, partial [Nocardia abscessus]|nr:hypothetical protein [Nocardia abscessus]